MMAKNNTTLMNHPVPMLPLALLPPLRGLCPTNLLLQRDLPLSNADGGSVLEYNLVIEDY
jgi:hypothetical protein